MGRKTTVSETQAGRQCKSPSNAMPSKTLPQETSLESLFDVKGFLFVMRNELRCHRARLVGMSLFWAWLQLVFTTRLYLSASCAADNAPQLQQFVWLASLACTLATFCVVLVIANRLPPRWERKSSTLVASHTLMVIGTMMLVLSSRGDGTAWMLLIGTLATGIGSGVLSFSGAHIFLRLLLGACSSIWESMRCLQRRFPASFSGSLDLRCKLELSRCLRYLAFCLLLPIAAKTRRLSIRSH